MPVSTLFTVVVRGEPCAREVQYYGVKYSTDKCGIIRKEGNKEENFSLENSEADEMIRCSTEVPKVMKLSNAGRTGIEIRVMYERHARRIMVWDNGDIHLGPSPGSPAYGPDGVDTGW